jgi:Retrotransposon gag protein
MNWGAEIVKDPFKQCDLFLSLIKGPKVKGWVQKTYDWLDQVKANPDDNEFPPGSNPWEILEEKFHNAFIDYVEHGRAQDELTKLKMTGGNVDGYITSFEFLSYQAGINPDEPSMQWLFARGLPRTLADACIDINNPKTFRQWASATQKHHCNWMHKRAIHGKYRQMQPCTSQPTGN